MNRKWFKFENMSVLDVALLVGVTAVFLAAALPVLKGALVRHRTAECARKILIAADAFDFYAEAIGHYPCSAESTAGIEGAFDRLGVDWWRQHTDLGGHWCWYSNGDTSSVVISGERIPEKKMVGLDELIDDGNLETGAFQRRAARYHYILNQAVL